MKTIFVLACCLVLTSFIGKPAVQNNEYYFILTVHGTFGKRIGFSSQPIKYPGYTACNRKSGSTFTNEARSNFSIYLNNIHPDIFPYPYSANSNILLVDMKENSTSQLLKTFQDAIERSQQWEKSQRQEGYRVIVTDFRYICK